MYFFLLYQSFFFEIQVTVYLEVYRGRKSEPAQETSYRVLYEKSFLPSSLFPFLLYFHYIKGIHFFKCYKNLSITVDIYHFQAYDIVIIYLTKWSP